ncbi:YgiW/YdeI family stress tolerance OB fold protein [Sphingomonas sp. NCPPB 2930]
MKLTIFACGLVAVMIASTSHAQPSNTGSPAAAPAAVVAPAHGAYVGPTSLPLMTTQQVRSTGQDDQKVRLQGRITSHAHGKHYTFSDASGNLQVEISSKRFPAGTTIGADQRVELFGEIEKGFRTLKVKVEEVRVMS